MKAPLLLLLLLLPILLLGSCCALAFKASGSGPPSSSAFDCTFSSSYPPTYKALFTPTPPPVDPFDPFWNTVPSSEKFVDIRGGTEPTPRYDTAVKMVYDDDYLYVKAEVAEPQIWANITHDNTVIFQDNDFEVFVDADASTHNYKEIEVNANGKVWNLCLNRPYDNNGYENSSRVTDPSFDMLSDGNKTEASWPDLKAAVATYPRDCINNPKKSGPRNEWAALLSLPLSGLIFNTTKTEKPKVGEFWRINFSRVEWRVLVDEVENNYIKDPAYPEDNWVWAPIGIIAMHNPDKWGLLQFGGELGSDSEKVVSNYTEWPIRQMAMMVYYAQRRFFEINRLYTTSLEAIAGFSPIEGALSSGCANIAIKTISSEEGGQDGFRAEVSMGGRTAFIDDSRYLIVTENVIEQTS